MMILYKSGWGTDTQFFPTFKMMPTSNDCPFNEVLYDPKSKVLAIVGKEKKQAYRLIPKLNDKGKPTIAVERGMQVEVQERKLMENFYEYYLEDVDDIKNFIKLFATNSKEFDWESFIKSDVKPEEISDVKS
jgi:hypothetical protein